MGLNVRGVDVMWIMAGVIILASLLFVDYDAVIICQGHFKC